MRSRGSARSHIAPCRRPARGKSRRSGPYASRRRLFRADARHLIQQGFTSFLLPRRRRLPLSRTNLPFTAQPLDSGIIHQRQRLRRASSDTGRLTRGMFTTEIALLRQQRLLIPGGGHLDGAKRTGNHAVFTANTIRLLKLNAVIRPIQCLRRTRGDAGGVVTVVTGGGAALLMVEDNVDTRKKVTTLCRPGILVMPRHTSYLTNMATNAAGGIGDNKSIHVRPFYYSE